MFLPCLSACRLTCPRRVLAWPAKTGTFGEDQTRVRFEFPDSLLENDQDRFQDPFQSETLPAGGKRETGSWTFLVLPKNASAKLPSRGMTAIEGTLNGFPFQATLEPDGQKSHWLKVDQKLSEAAGAEPGDVVTLEIAPAAEEPEPEVPSDLRKALAAADPKTRALWSDITPIARRDWIHWITSAKQSETRARRIKNACSMLAAGKRRVCCFDRSGFYSKSLSAPKAADGKAPARLNPSCILLLFRTDRSSTWLTVRISL